MDKAMFINTLKQSRAEWEVLRYWPRLTRSGCSSRAQQASGR